MEQNKLFDIIDAITPEIAKKYNLTIQSISFSTISSMILFPNFIFGIIALFQTTNYSDQQCFGLESITINQYLSSYAIFTLIVIGYLIFSIIISVIFYICEIILIPKISLMIGLLFVICYIVFLTIWQYLGIVVLIYTANCHTYILPQWTLTFMIILYGLFYTKNIVKNKEATKKIEENPIESKTEEKKGNIIVIEDYTGK